MSNNKSNKPLTKRQRKHSKQSNAGSRLFQQCWMLAGKEKQQFLLETQCTSTIVYINRIRRQPMLMPPRMIRGTEKSELSILSWNVEGLCKCLDDQDFLNCIYQYDLLFFGETWEGSTI